MGDFTDELSTVTDELTSTTEVELENDHENLCKDCKQTIEGSWMIQCHKCKSWYHMKCVGLKCQAAKTMSWICYRCALRDIKKKFRGK